MIPMNNKTMSFPLWLQIQVMHPLQLEVILVVWIQKNQIQRKKNTTKYIWMDNYGLLKFVVV
jgi:hypothetical protein